MDRVLLVLLAVTCVIGALLAHRALLPRKLRRPQARCGLAVYIVIVFSIVYIGFLLLTMSVANPSTELSTRTLAPVYVALMVVVPGALVAWWRSLGGRPCRRLAVLGIVGLVFGDNLVQTALWISEGSSDGLGLGKLAWQHSALIARVRTLPLEQQVYTNGTQVMALYGDRPWGGLPQTIDTPHAEYVARLKALRERLEEHTAVLVYFDGLTPPVYHSPSIDQLREYIPLRLLDAEADGAIYTAD